MATTASTQTPDLSFREALRRLDAAGLLLKVEDEVDTDLEVTGIMFTQPERAMLFQRVRGYGMQMIGNFMGSEENVLAIYQKDVSEVRRYIAEGLGSPMPPTRVASGPVQEVVHDNPDLLEHLPLPKYAPQDGGRYISAGVVIAKDAETGVYNASFHRFMHVERNRLLIRLDFGRHLRALWERAKAKGEPLPIAIVLGPDIGTLYAAAIMGAQLPLEMDEYHVASGIRRKPVELIDCRTVPLQVPADAEVVMEGYISPTEEMQEGPFLDFTTLYSEVEPAPVVTITCLYHRKNPIWHVIMTNEAPLFRKHLLEGAILKAVKAAAPCVTDVVLTAGGLYRFHLHIAVRKRSAADEGYQRNAIYAAITALKDLDLIIVVDDDIDIRNWTDVEWALAMRWDASRGIILLPASRGHEIAPISEAGVRAKVGIDATLPFGFTKRHKRIPIPPADLSRYRTSLAPGFSPSSS
ncbi:MAG: UbiD family decarboxylase [Candidatus Tectomicrobia bacterium]|nr:UbiD family decarboxylase [Candidatus Tectomicrobia bacterium]